MAEVRRKSTATNANAVRRRISATIWKANTTIPKTTTAAEGEAVTRKSPLPVAFGADSVRNAAETVPNGDKPSEVARAFTQNGASPYRNGN